ncbi:hypothetical protein HDR69_05660, partial [bacterium]|nr:hypothetical protein [bacterium]
MLKSLIPTLLLLLTLLPLTGRAQDTDELSNPVYIGALLLDEPAERDMAKLCEYYGFTPSGTDNSFTLYTRSDGAEIRFRATGDRNNTDPVIEIRCPQSTRDTHE